MKRWSELLILFGCITVAFGAISMLHISEADACGGTPPPPNCGVAVNCSLAVNETLASNESGTISSDYASSLFVTVSGVDPRCSSLGATASFDIQSTCLDPVTDEEQAGGTTALSTSVGQGLNRIPMSMSLEPAGNRFCYLSGGVEVTLDTGQTVTAQCAEQTLCTASPSPTDPNKPLIDLELLDHADGVVTASAGEPEVLRYRITNNSDHEFNGFFFAESENSERPLQTGALPAPDPDPAVVCVQDIEAPEEAEDCSEVETDPECGCNDVTFANSCLRENAGIQMLHSGACEAPAPEAQGFSISMQGDGDNFPIAFRDESPNDTCLPMPENPALYTDASISRIINVAANSSHEIELVQRSWGLCADGSCSRTNVAVSGQVGNDDVTACGGGAFVVVDGEGSPAPSDSTCFDSGSTPGSGTWNDPEEPDFEVKEELDSNGNGVPDVVEEFYGYDSDDPDTPSNPEDYSHEALLEIDSNDNGVSDAVEIAFGYDPLDPTTPSNPEDYFDDVLLDQDSAGNGVSDYEEIYVYGSDPLDPDDPVFFVPYESIDTTGNGVPDYIEVLYGYDPTDPTEPSNPDTYTWENLLETDSNGNGVPDAVEIAFGYDPFDETTPINPSEYSEDALQNRDSDGDGLSDYDEVYIYQTDPLNHDTDGDGYGDGDEIDMGTDPLDPRDPAGTPFSNTPKAGIIFEGSHQDLSTLVLGSGSHVSNIDVFRTRATAINLTPQIGRIYETVEVNPESIAAGERVAFTMPFEVMPLNESSPYEINRLQLGIKALDSSHDGSYLTGAGIIRYSNSPYTIFEFMYRISIWAINSDTGKTEQLYLDDENFEVDYETFEVTVSTEAPDFAYDEFYLMHDLNAHERVAYQEICNDGVDNNNNGLTDCDDPYCDDDPACSEDNNGGDDNGGDDTGGNNDNGGDDNGGDNTGDNNDNGGDDTGGNASDNDGDRRVERGCSATGSGPPAGLIVMVVLGFALARRRTLRDEETGHVV